MLSTACAAAGPACSSSCSASAFLSTASRKRWPTRAARRRSCSASDPRVREDVVLIGALRRELRDDRAVVARLEPMQRVRRNRELVSGLEHDLVVPFDVQVHDAGPAAERLLLARTVADGRVTV